MREIFDGRSFCAPQQPFQGWLLPKLSIDFARHSSENLPDSILFIGAKMEPSCTNLSLPRFASNRPGSELSSAPNRRSRENPRATPASLPACRSERVPLAPELLRRRQDHICCAVRVTQTFQIILLSVSLQAPTATVGLASRS